MRPEHTEMIGTGRGRTRLELHADGRVGLRMMVRPIGDGRGPYHRTVLEAPEGTRDLTSRGFPRQLLDEELYADTGVTLADVAEGYVEAHRTPERLKRWELQKAEIAEAERLEMDAPRER